MAEMLLKKKKPRLQCNQCFLPGNRNGKFGVLKLPVSRGIYVGIPGNFFSISMDFSGTDIYYSDIKNALLQTKNFFC